MSRSMIILLNLIFVVPFASAKDFIRSPSFQFPVVIGSSKPILDLNDPIVQDIAKFAVAEYNKQVNSVIYSLAHVNSGRHSNSSSRGDIYWLNIKVANGAKLEDYRAVVNVNPSRNTKILWSFLKRGPVLGFYKPIKDLNSKLVQDIAKFAVKEYSKWVNSTYSLVKVKNAWRKEKISGVYYDLIVKVTNGTVLGDYNARFSFDKVHPRPFFPRIPIN